MSLLNESFPMKKVDLHHLTKNLLDKKVSFVCTGKTNTFFAAFISARPPFRSVALSSAVFQAQRPLCFYSFSYSLFSYNSEYISITSADHLYRLHNIESNFWNVTRPYSSFARSRICKELFCLTEIEMSSDCLILLVSLLSSHPFWKSFFRHTLDMMSPYQSIWIQWS